MPPAHTSRSAPTGDQHSPGGAYRPTKSRQDTPGTYARPRNQPHSTTDDRAEARQQERRRLRSCALSRSLAFGEEGDLFQVSDLDCDLRIPLHYSLNDHVRLVQVPCALDSE